MRYQRTSERRAVILMVVLSLLTLFALVGVTFVLYADAEATAARVAREAETMRAADVNPQQALAFILGQIIYDVPDTPAGAASGLRGHSLARTMYGSNSVAAGLNILPYSGIGRVHTNNTATGWPYQNSLNTDDYLLVNYTWFQGYPFARDPEWYTATPQLAPVAPGYPKTATTYYVGANAPYTYPDLNSFFLAAVRSDGTVLAPSFHRPWLFNPGKALNDMTNLNWTNPQGRYLTLRPRPPFDHPNFPAPDDAYGDVKNLPWSKTNDSIWIDPGGPVMTAPDGTPFKMLVAPCIIDLDNRINVGTAGNIEGGGTTSRSNQGWFPSEVNLSYLWQNSTAVGRNEWLNLFLGNPPGTQPTVPPAGYFGKYGKSLAPGGLTPALSNLLPGGVIFPNGSPAHVYAQADLDGRIEANGGPTGPVQLPGTGAAPANSCFPTFPVGYGSGSQLERTYHAAYYDVYKSALWNKTNDNFEFPPSDMEALLRSNNSLGNVDTGSSALISNLMRLCPNSLGTLAIDAFATQRRNWITTVSTDLARPGLSPWVYNPADPTSMYLVNPLTPSLPPLGWNTTTPPPPGAPNPYISFTTFAQRSAPAGTPNPPIGSEYAPSWQSVPSALGRVDLNRPLPPYPHMSAGLATALVLPNARYDSGANSAMAPNVQTSFQTATAARQQLAIEIYLRLLAVTGVKPPATPATPTPADLAPRRWLAQLAANIVDYIDDDEVSTPFCFYNPANAALFGLPSLGANNYQVTPSSMNANDNSNTIPVWPGPPPATTGNPDLPTYWVFGTELPRVVINEALGEYAYTANFPPAANDTVKTNVWVELFNTLPPPATVTTTATTNGTILQPLDATPEVLYQPVGAAGTAAYNPYQVVIANNSIAPNSYSLWVDTITAGMNNNVLGTPQQIRYSVPPTAGNPNGVQAACNFGFGPNEIGANETAAGMVGTVGNMATLNYAISPAGGLPGQSYLLVGPSAQDANNDITAASGVPAVTPFVISPNMMYQVTTNASYKWSMAVPPPPGSPANTPPGSIPITDNGPPGPGNGILVLLRRLANPHLPPNPFVQTGTPPVFTLANPALPPNPYVTVDYTSPIALNGYNGKNSPPTPLATTNTPPNYGGPTGTLAPASSGKFQPYQAGAYAGQTRKMTGATGGVNYHTLGLANAPLASPFTWLVHLDRALISPMELLHVSGFAPHMLTQRFIFNIAGGNSTQSIAQPYNYTAPILVPASLNGANPPAGYPASFSCFQHYVPWFDQSRRLYRFFEMVDTRSAAAGVSPINGRVPGKININTLWDLPLGATGAGGTNPPTPAYSQMYQAIADPSATPNNPKFNLADVNTVFQNLLKWRSPGLVTAGVPASLSAGDHPFIGMGTGVALGTDPQYPNGGLGINNTLLTSGLGTQPITAGPQGQGPALQLPNPAPPNPNPTVGIPQIAHPYMQNELLTKIYNRLTTRSNVYAVFLTVGFFQVTGTFPGTTMPQLGAEIGRSEGKQIRHRMFAIVDRTNLNVMSPPFPTLTGAAVLPASAVPNTGITVAPGSPPLPYNVSLSPPLTGKNVYTGATWTIGAGSTVVLEPGTDNEETVTLVPSTQPGQFTAVFYKSHAAGVPVVLRGNPGPWSLLPYDPRLDPSVVLYFSIID